MQANYSDCSGVAQHTLVLGSSGQVQPNPSEPAQSAQPIDTTLQSDSSQKSDKSISPCMAPRASAIKEQGFSSLLNQVRFRAPPVNSVADLCTCFRTGSCTPAPLMVTGQLLLINWGTHTSISAKMKISRVSWIVPTETDPKPEGNPLLEPLPGFAPADKVSI